MSDEQTAQGQSAAPETNEKPVARTGAESPYSGNVRARLGGFDWQLTIRESDPEAFVKKILGMNTWLKSKQAETNSQPHAQAIPQPPAVPIAPPPPIPAAPPQSQASGQVVCQMIEVGLSFKTQKTQLKFHCNGLDKPITVTQSPEDMAKLISPLGFTQAHIVVGQKYTTSALVNWISSSDGKYKNIASVTQAA